MSMTLIENIPIPSGSYPASVVFSDIPTDGTYTDLYLIASVRGDRSDVWESINIWPNQSSANMTARRLYTAQPGSPVSTTVVGNFVNGNTSTTNTYGHLTVYIPNYASSNYKSLSVESGSEGSGTVYYGIYAYLWSDTTAISSLELDGANGLLRNFSTFTLYGILAGSDGTTIVS